MLKCTNTFVKNTKLYKELNMEELLKHDSMDNITMLFEEFM
jgi:hypothetical protein